MQLLYPLDKIHITQHFGERPQFYRPLNGHNGIDFRTKFSDSPNGNIPVYAVAHGQVKEIGDQGNAGFGKYVRLQHEDGSETVYGHLSEIIVLIHQQVTQRQQLGVAGNTGFSSAPHLHFSYRPSKYDYGNGFAGYIDPLELFSEEEFPYPYFEKVEGSSAVYAYDHKIDKFIPVGSGEVFLLLRGSYEGIKIVKQLSREIVQDQTIDIIKK